MGVDLRYWSETGVGNNFFLEWNRVRILRSERLKPTKNSREYPPQPPGYLPGIDEKYFIFYNENSFQFCGRNYLQTDGTAMGTKMAVAFANILMARIEDQILRQSCIEPHPGHQRIFLGCGGMRRCRRRLTELWPKAEVTRGEAARKKAFHAGHFKRLYQTGNRT